MSVREQIMTSQELKEKRISRWYFGGLASAGAACCTHPLDLIKVTLQTQQEGKVSIVQLTGRIVRQQGVLALYNGISASLLRQLTYSTARFGIYEVGKQSLDSNAGFASKVLLAGTSGFIGGIIGTPADMVNVRMQNDVKLPPESRRNYKNAIDGLLRVRREEGASRLFSGALTASSRGFMMTVGQIAFYDQRTVGRCKVYGSTGTAGIFQRIRSGIRTPGTTNNYHIFVVGTIAYEFRIFERRVGERLTNQVRFWGWVDLI
ncbi:mitochondrial dicarboxylate carrier isoform X3 [Bradysia coprophila]|uniref:mitochondrial dicarboxylate carrier isoform X3 n=1 Tax=Bradysia coprophila TaxID=38358 RepID=UPI00187D9736|nr:mitochondrial dicarboxylate carrier isoform X3 [Bradysia coprophila]